MRSQQPRPDDSDPPTCRSRRHDPGTAPSLVRGLRVCAACREVIEETLIELPALFDLCAGILDLGSADLGERVSESRPPGFNLCDTAVSVRSEILGALVAWSWFVTRERGIPGPSEFAIRELVRFLAIQLQWLCRHSGAPALVDELTDLTAAVSAALQHTTYVRVAVGTCPLQDCGTTVYAEAPGEGAEAYEAACEAGHVWSPHRWLAMRAQDDETGNSTDRAPRPENAE